MGDPVSPTPEDQETPGDLEACGEPRAGVSVGGGMIHQAVPPLQFVGCHCSPAYPHLGGCGVCLTRLGGSLPHLRKISDPLWGGPFRIRGSA